MTAKKRLFAARTNHVALALLFLVGLFFLVIEGFGASSSPIANFSAYLSSEFAPLTVSFDASSSMDVGGEITQYYWDFGDNAWKTGMTVTHTYTKPGNYTVTLTITDSMGETATSSQVIEVTAAVAPSETSPIANFIAYPSSGFAPLTVSFDASSSIGVGLHAYYWDFGDNVWSNGITVTHIYTEPGNYTVTLTITDSMGETATSSQVIEVTAAVAPSETSLATIQPGDILYHPAVYAGDVPLVFLPFATLDEGLSSLGHVGLVDWNYRVIEAEKEGVIARYSIADFVNRYASSDDPFVYVLRVKASQDVINKAIQFARDQIGKPYDFDYAVKELFGSSYYCSELIWAAYEYASGAHYNYAGHLIYGYINLDAGDPPEYVTILPVSPNEIFRSSWTYTLGKIYSQ